MQGTVKSIGSVGMSWHNIKTGRSDMIVPAITPLSLSPQGFHPCHPPAVPGVAVN